MSSLEAFTESLRFVLAEDHPSVIAEVSAEKHATLVASVDRAKVLIYVEGDPVTAAFVYWLPDGSQESRHLAGWRSTGQKSSKSDVQDFWKKIWCDEVENGKLSRPTWMQRQEVNPPEDEDWLDVFLSLSNSA